MCKAIVIIIIIFRSLFFPWLPNLELFVFPMGKRVAFPNNHRRVQHPTWHKRFMTFGTKGLSPGGIETPKKKLPLVNGGTGVKKLTPINWGYITNSYKWSYCIYNPTSKVVFGSALCSKERWTALPRETIHFAVIFYLYMSLVLQRCSWQHIGISFGNNGTKIKKRKAA